MKINTHSQVGRLFCPPFTTSKVWSLQCGGQKKRRLKRLLLVPTFGYTASVWIDIKKSTYSTFAIANNFPGLLCQLNPIVFPANRCGHLLYLAASFPESRGCYSH